jgi:erythromycin esterase-like protein
MLSVMIGSVAGTGGRERLYFASMDIQPGMGGTPIKKAVMRRFIERVLAYSGEPDAGAAAEKLSVTLDPLRTCAGEQPPPPERVDAVAKVVQAIRSADPKVRAVLPMHADALALVPTMLDERLHHCSEIVGPGNSNQYWKNYKEARDRYQAANVVALRDKVSRSHRVVVWGHHSHVGYHAAGARASVSISGVLRDRLPGETYALGLFAGAGRYLRVQDGPRLRARHAACRRARSSSSSSSTAASSTSVPSGRSGGSSTMSLPFLTRARTVNMLGS